MKNPYVTERIFEAIAVVNRTVNNFRLYPPTSAVISQTMDRLLESFEAIFETEDSIILAESEQMLLIDGDPVGRKNQERPAIKSFTELLMNLGIDSVSFLKNVTKEELTFFFQMLAGKLESHSLGGSLAETLARLEVVHIRVDEKVYLAKDKSQLMATVEIKDQDILNFLTGADPNAADLEKVKEKARDPEWLSDIFKYGMEWIKGRQGAVPYEPLSENSLQLLRQMEKIVDPAYMERIASIFASSVTEMDTELVSRILLKDVEGVMGGRFFEKMLDELDDKRFASVVDEIAKTAAAPGEMSQVASSVLGKLRSTEKGQKLESERQAQTIRENEERQQRLSQLRERLRGLLEQNEPAVRNLGRIAEIPGIIRELYFLEDSQTAHDCLIRLSKMLHLKDHDVSYGVAEVLSQILDDLLADGRVDLSYQVAEKLVGWMRSETDISPICEKICRQCKELGRAVLEQDPFVEYNPVLDTLSLIQSGRSPKEGPLRALVSEALSDLATEDLLDALLQEFQTNALRKQKEAGRNLGRIGKAPVERLLDMLRDSEDSDERVRILQVFSQIGEPAIPAITQRMATDQPWYVHRNLIYILGRVGIESQATKLAPFLLHENEKIQEECLKSLQRIGGKVRAETLLSALPKVDGPFKMSIVEMLGTIKASTAVPALVELLRSKAKSMPLKADLDEKICTALGKIGSMEALPALQEIADAKGFLGISSYPAKVKIAAGKAISALSRSAT